LFFCFKAVITAFITDGTSCVGGDVRLVDGTDQSFGRVEICHLNVWGSICSDSWSENDGLVVCHQLGLSYLGITAYAFHRQGSKRIWLSDVHCSGSEAVMTNCTHSGFDIHHCSEVAGVRCDGKWFMVTNHSHRNFQKEFGSLKHAKFNYILN